MRCFDGVEMEQYTPEEAAAAALRETLTRTFVEMDEDGSGGVAGDVLRVGLLGAGICQTEEEVDVILKRYDDEPDGGSDAGSTDHIVYWTLVEVLECFEDLQVSFQWKNPDFLLRNPDFRLKNVDFIIKQEKEEHKEDPVAKLTDLFHNIDDDQTGWVDSKVRTQEIYQAPACIYPPELISARCCRNYMKVCSAEVLVSPPRRSMSCSPLGITTATVG